MKRHSPARLAAVLLIGLAFVPALSAQAPSQLFGTWKLNPTKSSFSPGPPPKSMTITYSPVGFGMKIVVDLTPAAGAAQHWEMRPMFDGADHPVTGNPDADTISIKRISDTKGESTLKKKGGKAMAVNVRTLAPDGKSMTIETKGTTADGKPRHDVAVYEK
ncbi:MAG: hypothetical protein ABIX28_10340 [Vicinamibacterales bacterium]